MEKILSTTLEILLAVVVFAVSIRQFSPTQTTTCPIFRATSENGSGTTYNGSAIVNVTSAPARPGGIIKN